MGTAGAGGGEGDGAIGWLRRKFATVAEKVTLEEIEQANTTCLVATAGGFILGGLDASRGSAARHMKKNESTRYRSSHQAQRELNDAVIRDFGRGGLRVGIRTGLFTGILMVGMLSLEKIRGSRDAMNPAVAGTVAGAVLRLPAGLSAAANGALIGGGLSTVYGLLLHALWTLEDTLESQRPTPPSVQDPTPAPADPLDDMLANFEAKSSEMAQDRYVSPRVRAWRPSHPTDMPTRRWSST